ncbi:hypothetical protein CYLTODRAFT_460700 [Cylindrobasidium torrendii FP15055 ss-10]|uniref:Uncharacterized protein n=1 Tax=Cylindrobasidium torrendii FP15055 ss-10 TaxID=1314674 RepID=A0A0D7AQQ1_9AGAR|nr:hypothetical protein CYLTODRAFT_460700 [Cylindrobasidium torrendii FP15055 ss-10]
MSAQHGLDPMSLTMPLTDWTAAGEDDALSGLVFPTSDTQLLPEYQAGRTLPTDLSTQISGNTVGVDSALFNVAVSTPEAHSRIQLDSDLDWQRDWLERDNTSRAPSSEQLTINALARGQQSNSLLLSPAAHAQSFLSPHNDSEYDMRSDWAHDGNNDDASQAGRSEDELFLSCGSSDTTQDADGILPLYGGPLGTYPATGPYQFELAHQAGPLVGSMAATHVSSAPPPAERTVTHPPSLETNSSCIDAEPNDGETSTVPISTWELCGVCYIPRY